MPYSTPSLSSLIAQGEGDIDFYLQGSQARLPFSIERSLNFANSAMMKDAYDHQEWIARQIIPTKNSDDEWIVKHAERRGVIRKKSSASIGPVSISVNPGTQVLLGQRFQRGDGVIFTAQNAVTEQDGQVTLSVKAQSSGKATNCESGVELTPMSNIVGAKGNAIVGKDGLRGGADIESISDLLYRLQLKMRNPPQGGALFDYEQWALEVPGVTRAWANNAWQGRGTIGLTFVNDNEVDILPSNEQLDGVKNYCIEHQDPATGVRIGMPAGPELVPYALTLKVIALRIQVAPDTLETRKAVTASLKALEVREVRPNGTLLISDIRQAIKTAASVRDYTCNITEDQTSKRDELLTFGAITWL
ncbi:baseplate J/gp47 family protein [Vibrio scophthalmi]|uniref:Uncharacterized protein n=1 Tax=Vibrio scophthalmi LMG 19158 TaxID=870967 RepID=F9RTI3_9VIBR|nr:baseplate J/gp47 family protein [Vibrio scophthalmi]EGU31081.1 hypothetical protein VIS19158_06215 [Vibrio scophthalmi LMG 19158]